MKKIYFTLICFCCVGFLSAQVIVTESFEAAIPAGGGSSQGDCGCLTVPDQFSDGSSDYYGRQNNGTISANVGTGYAGFAGSWYFAGEDHDSPDCNSPCTSTLCFTMDNVVVPNPTESRSYLVSVLVGGNASSGNYDPADDFVGISYSVNDQATWVPLVCFSPTAAGGGLFHLTEDSDCIEPGDNLSILAGAMAAYSGSFSALNPMNNRVHLQVCAGSSAGNEEWAIDLLQITDSGLPIDLTAFEAVPQDKDVMLNWTTESESNNAYFYIQRSTDGRSYETIERVDGAGNSLSTINYEYLDRDVPKEELLYYRLNQVDFDGKMTNSQVRVVRMKHNQVGFVLSPNLVTNVVNLHFNEVKQTAENFNIEVYDIQGQQIFQTTISNREQNFAINTEDFVPGAYLVKVSTNNWQETKRFVKVRP